MEESAQNTFEYFCAAAFNFGVRRTARIVHEVQIASKFRIPGIFLTYIGNRMYPHAFFVLWTAATYTSINDYVSSFVLRSVGRSR